LTLKVIHVPFTYYPGAVGGTEVYVASLARNLQSKGVECVVAAPGSTERAELYEHEGIGVRRFPVTSTSRDMLSELYGDGDPYAAGRFGEILDQEQPDVVHMHAFTRGVSLLTAREVKQRGIKLVFTYHTPTVSCQRGTLLRYGHEVCDGVLDRTTCTRCTLQSLGVNGFGGKVLSAVPQGIGRALGAAHLGGGMWTALQMTNLIQLRHDAFRELMREVDAIIALCQWVQDLLIGNGVEEQKITVSRHGLPHESNGPSQSRLPVAPLPLRIAFLGRIHATKGPDILIRAIHSRPDLDVRLDLYGIVQGSADEHYLEELKAMAADDSRVSFLPAVPGEKVVSAISSYHLLAVPSRWLETGPLVVLEAFAACVPVIGSKLGGIAELIEDGRNGLLVDDDSPDSWAKEIARLANDRMLLGNLRSAVPKPRSMQDVAAEMLTLYRGLAPQAGIRPATHKQVEAYV